MAPWGTMPDLDDKRIIIYEFYDVFIKHKDDT